MKIKELFESCIFDLVSSGLGVALIIYSFGIKSENQYLFVDFNMQYENKKALKGLIKIDATELEWKSEPAFTLEKLK